MRSILVSLIILTFIIILGPLSFAKDYIGKKGSSQECEQYKFSTVEILKEKCANGDLKACDTLGVLYFQGYKVVCQLQFYQVLSPYKGKFHF